MITEAVTTAPIIAAVVEGAMRRSLADILLECPLRVKFCCSASSTVEVCVELFLPGLELPPGGGICKLYS